MRAQQSDSRDNNETLCEHPRSAERERFNTLARRAHFLSRRRNHEEEDNDNDNEEKHRGGWRIILTTTTTTTRTTTTIG